MTQTPKPVGENRVQPYGLLSVTFGAAILTIGLTEYRPLLARAGNLSDVLFLMVFGAGVGTWLVRFDRSGLRGLFQDFKRVELLFWGGLTLTLGGIVASLDSASPELSWNVTFKYFTMFCVWLPWVAFAAKRYLPLERSYVLYVIGLGVVATMSLLDVMAGTRFGVWMVTMRPQLELQDLLALRYGGPTGHPNSLGSLAAIGFLLSVALVIERRSLRAATGATLGCVVFAASLLISGSRAALLGAGTGVLVLLMLSPRGSARRIAVPLVACFAVLGIVSTIPRLSLRLPQNPIARLMESVSPRRDFAADWSRRRDLQSAVTLLERDPLTGYGMENVGTTGSQTIGFNLHNTILQSWVAGGLLGALGTIALYVAALGGGWIAVRRRYPLSPPLLSVCVCMIVIDLTQPHLYIRFKWFAIALLFATLRGEGHPAGRAVTRSGGEATAPTR
jgi:O-antigen ligase